MNFKIIKSKNITLLMESVFGGKPSYFFEAIKRLITNPISYHNAASLKDALDVRYLNSITLSLRNSRFLGGLYR